MAINIITISRQYGSGGRLIGEMLANELGYAFYDKELIVKSAEESGFAEEFIKKYEEKQRKGGLVSFYSGNLSNYLTPEDHIWQIQHNVIEELVEEGPCVIVGRNSDYVLRNREDALHVFIHADDSIRMERIRAEYGDMAENPAKRIAEVDKSRSKNYKYYTDRYWGEAKNYSISLNSGKFGIEGCVKIILDLVRSANGEKDK